MKTEAIKETNKRIRKNLVNPDELIKIGNCRLIITKAVAAQENIGDILRAFSNLPDSYFTEDNDPHGEQDYAKVTINDENYIYKVDYYDSNLEFHGYDIFAMTIMMECEY